MRTIIFQILCTFSFFLLPFSNAAAAPAVEVLGKDYTFPNKIEGFPSKLSEFAGLQIFCGGEHYVVLGFVPRRVLWRKDGSGAT